MHQHFRAPQPHGALPAHSEHDYIGREREAGESGPREGRGTLAASLMATVSPLRRGHGERGGACNGAAEGRVRCAARLFYDA